MLVTLFIWQFIFRDSLAVKISLEGETSWYKWHERKQYDKLPETSEVYKYFYFYNILANRGNCFGSDKN